MAKVVIETLAQMRVKLRTLLAQNSKMLFGRVLGPDHDAIKLLANNMTKKGAKVLDLSVAADKNVAIRAAATKMKQGLNLRNAPKPTATVAAMRRHVLGVSKSPEHAAAYIAKEVPKGESLDDIIKVTKRFHGEDVAKGLRESAPAVTRLEELTPEEGIKLAEGRRGGVTRTAKASKIRARRTVVRKHHKKIFDDLTREQAGLKGLKRGSEAYRQTQVNIRALHKQASKAQLTAVGKAPAGPAPSWYARTAGGINKAIEKQFKIKEFLPTKLGGGGMRLAKNVGWMMLLQEILNTGQQFQEIGLQERSTKAKMLAQEAAAPNVEDELARMVMQQEQAGAGAAQQQAMQAQLQTALAPPPQGAGVDFRTQLW